MPVETNRSTMELDDPKQSKNESLVRSDHDNYTFSSDSKNGSIASDVLCDEDTPFNDSHRPIKREKKEEDVVGEKEGDLVEEDEGDKENEEVEDESSSTMIVDSLNNEMDIVSDVFEGSLEITEEAYVYNKEVVGGIRGVRSGGGQAEAGVENAMRLDNKCKVEIGEKTDFTTCAVPSLLLKDEIKEEKEYKEANEEEQVAAGNEEYGEDKAQGYDGQGGEEGDEEEEEEEDDDQASIDSAHAVKTGYHVVSEAVSCV